jgi:hypothetical protein
VVITKDDDGDDGDAGFSDVDEAAETDRECWRDARNFVNRKTKRKKEKRRRVDR